MSNDAQRIVSAEEARALMDDYQASECPPDCDGRCMGARKRLRDASPRLARTVEALHARVAELTERCERAERKRDTVVECARREHAERAAWLASLPDGSCGNPPPQALLDAEAATREALAAIGGAR